MYTKICKILLSIVIENVTKFENGTMPLSSNENILIVNLFF